MSQKLLIFIVRGPKSLSSTIKIELPELKEVIGTLRNATSYYGILSVDNP